MTEVLTLYVDALLLSADVVDKDAAETSGEVGSHDWADDEGGACGNISGSP